MSKENEIQLPASDISLMLELGALFHGNPLNVSPNHLHECLLFLSFFPSFFPSIIRGGRGEEVKKKLQKWVIIWLSAVKRPPGKRALGQRGAHNIPDLEPCGMR